MDNIRLFLLFALAYTGFLIWQAWQEDYGPKPTQAPVAQAVAPTDQGVPDAPSVAQIDSSTPEITTDTAKVAGSRLISVTTDTFNIKIDTRGGSIVQAFLEKYPVAVDQPDVKFELMGTSPADYFVAQSGLLSQQQAPNHQALYDTAQNSYTLEEGKDELVVELVWQGENQLKVTKRYTFSRGSHNVKLQHLVENGSPNAWNGREYRQLQRGEPQDSGNAFMYTYTGGVIYSPEDKYQKYDFEELGEGKLNRDVKNGWIAMIQHYFVAAFVPPREQTDHFYGKKLANGRYLIGKYTPAVSVAPGSSHQFEGSLYIGPKIQEDLAAIAKGLDLTVDYGWLSMISQPMYWILAWINTIVNNWGWTIIIFTILIKLAFYKLSETSYRSMANMRKLTPRIQALKDRYGDDKQRMQQAMMEMYKKEKINPLGGCLPMLIQMPFFIALYWVLMESVELRQAPWILWIQDLSIKDPFFILPVIMGASMYIQQKLNPAPPDPMQAKLIMMLPFVFTVMFAFFPSGLVLYWVMNNILSIAQQWVITKRIEEGTET